MLEALFEFLGELLLQIVVQILVEIGFEIGAAPFRRGAHPGLAALGYVMLGAIAGAISLLVAPHAFAHGGWRTLNLVLSPLLAGSLMAAVGVWHTRATPAQAPASAGYDRFAYGYLFALSVALVRFWWAAH